MARSGAQIFQRSARDLVSLFTNDTYSSSFPTPETACAQQPSRADSVKAWNAR